MYRGSIYGDTRNVQRKTCTYGDRMYVHRINVWRLDACMQMANPMETRCISKNAILYGNTVCVQRTNPTGMYKQRTNAQRMYCINEQSIRECDACAKDQSYGDMMYVLTINIWDHVRVQRTNPMGTRCKYIGQILCGHVQIQKDQS